LTLLQRIHAIKTLQYPLRTQVTGQIAKVTAEILTITTYSGWPVLQIYRRWKVIRSWSFCLKWINYCQISARLPNQYL